jgi:hypothetical protein
MAPPELLPTSQHLKDRMRKKVNYNKCFHLAPELQKINMTRIDYMMQRFSDR